MSKYGMSMCVLGMAEEFKEKGVAVNALWPRTGEIMRCMLFVIQNSKSGLLLACFIKVWYLLLLPRSSNGLSTLHNKGSSALQVLQAAVEFLAHGCWVWPDLLS